MIHRKKKIWLLTFLSLAMFWYIPLPQILFWNVSQSVPQGLYLKVPMETIAVGDFVVYSPTDEVLTIMKERGWLAENKNQHSFLKYVGGLSGDSYAVRDNKFFINGKFIGETLLCDTNGNTLPVIQGAHDIPAGEFLPVSDDVRSFDGRYTGTVPIERIIAKVIPLLVVN